MLLDTLGANLLGNLLAGKGIVRTSSGNKKGKSWHWKIIGFLMPLHPLTHFEIQKFYQNEPRYNGVFSRNNLPKKIKDGRYVINLDEYVDVGNIGLLYFVTERNLFITIVLVLNMFLKKLKNLLGIKT